MFFYTNYPAKESQGILYLFLNLFNCSMISNIFLSSNALTELAFLRGAYRNTCALAISWLIIFVARDLWSERSLQGKKSPDRRFLKGLYAKRNKLRGARMKEGLFLSGFADEAADDIRGQIRAVKALGWSHFEARSVDGVNIHDLSEAAFEEVCAGLEEAGVGINCFGSTIANWGSRVDDDFSVSLEAVERAIRRMRRLKVPLVRIMSYALICDDKGRPLEAQKEELRFDRLREICARFLDAGLTPVHENCFNYGGMSWEHTLTMLEAVPGLKLVYDTGNPCLTPDFRKPWPWPNQDSLEAWEHLKEHVVHIHIKDGRRNPATGEEAYIFPGEGDGELKKILADALAGGYGGSFTIEPHMASVFHDPSVSSSAEKRFENFVEYGRRTCELFCSLGCTVRAGVIYPAALS
jgi:sugar phosphate isomerase/epimerase